MTNKERLYKQINKLSALKDGWFGGSGLAPNSNAIDNCKKIIDSLSEDILEHCAVFPCVINLRFLPAELHKQHKIRRGHF